MIRTGRGIRFVALALRRGCEEILLADSDVVETLAVRDDACAQETSMKQHKDNGSTGKEMLPPPF